MLSEASLGLLGFVISAALLDLAYSESHDHDGWKGAFASTSQSYRRAIIMRSEEVTIIFHVTLEQIHINSCNCTVTRATCCIVGCQFDRPQS